MLRAEVPSASVANAKRAFMGRFDSITNRNGVRKVERPIDDREKIFRRRNAVVRGPLYTNGSSITRGVSGVFAVEVERSAYICCLDDEVERPRVENDCHVRDTANFFEHSGGANATRASSSVVRAWRQLCPPSLLLVIRSADCINSGTVALQKAVSSKAEVNVGGEPPAAARLLWTSPNQIQTRQVFPHWEHTQRPLPSAFTIVNRPLPPWSRLYTT